MTRLQDILVLLTNWNLQTSKAPTLKLQLQRYDKSNSHKKVLDFSSQTQTALKRIILFFMLFFFHIYDE